MKKLKFWLKLVGGLLLYYWLSPLITWVLAAFFSLFSDIDLFNSDTRLEMTVIVCTAILYRKLSDKQ